MVDATSKFCKKCGSEKALADFYRNSRNPDGLYAWCRPCALERANAWNRENPERAKFTRNRWRENNPDRWHEQTVLRFQNMTSAGYRALLDEQGGVCAICRGACQLGYRLAVDHDHQCCPRTKEKPSPIPCGKCIRGLLCRRCNQVLGSLGDSPALFRAAADYLETTQKRFESGWTSEDLDRSPRPPVQRGRPIRRMEGSV